jgi:CheY-like chemotaxis protein
MKILHVEDNAAHAELVKNTIMAWDDSTELKTVENGTEAEQELVKNREKNKPYDLILLDVNLPDTSGIDVLRKITKSPIDSIRRTPVVILTTSPAQEDVEAATDAHAAAYIIKPLRYAEFQKVVSSIPEFYSHAYRV